MSPPETGTEEATINTTRPAPLDHAPSTPRSLEARRIVRAELGADTIRALHRASRPRDLWWTIWPPVSVVVVAAVIGAADSWFIRVPLIVLQGFCIVNCANVAHSMFTHRRPFGRRAGRWQGLMLATVATLSGSIYTASHHHHHRALNTPLDQDFENVDLDRSWKRLLYASSILGYLAASGRVLADGRYRDRIWNARAYFRRRLWADPTGRRHLIGEFTYVALYWAAVVALAFWWPAAVLIGYLVPLLLTAPLANSLRESTEHFDLELSNPLAIATLYEPGWFTRAFNHQTGTTHWVHHLWPDIPHYRCPEAWQLMRPIAERHGLQVRTSFLDLALDYYLRGKSRVWYRTTGGERVDVATLSAFADPAVAAERRARRPAAAGQAT